MTSLQSFGTKPFITALKDFFAELHVPVSTFADEPAKPQDVLGEAYKPESNDAHALIGDVYVLGVVNDAIFQGTHTIGNVEAVQQLTSDYDGLLLAGITLRQRTGGLLPSRSQLAEITRAFNRAFPYMPVTVVFLYGGDGNTTLLSFANSERTRYKQEWREGEKPTNVGILYNVDCGEPHAAHLRVLESLMLSRITERNGQSVTSFRRLDAAWREVFSTNILNKQFYEDFQRVMRSVVHQFQPAFERPSLARQAVLALMNRLIFLYFVQRKGWLAGDFHFMRHLWSDYKAAKEQKPEKFDTSSFHADWLNELFFNGFNKGLGKHINAHRNFTDKYKALFPTLPYLNGGLFYRHNDIDGATLPDAAFETIIAFLESYLFTVAEDTPLEVTLEVSPELLGKMYESMVNNDEAEREEGEHGINYTERPEINFMVRRSLVEVLWRKLPSINANIFTRDALYHICFNDNEQRQEYLKRLKVSPQHIELLRNTLLSMTACDPACGSGSMLLGLLHVIVEIVRSLDVVLGKPHTLHDDYALKKSIIANQLYGVDVKEWAVRIAELRLWLSMIAEADFTHDELLDTALLPNLDFNLRHGNALLPAFEETAQKLMNSATGSALFRSFIKRKKQFIRNELRGVSYDDIKAEETLSVQQALSRRITLLQQQLQELSLEAQNALFADTQRNDIFATQRAEIEAEIAQLETMKRSIRDLKRLPFSFEIDFMEIFSVPEYKPDRGFDLVIGNPPYVAFEDILPPDNPEQIELWMQDTPEARDAKREANSQFKEALNAKIYRRLPVLASTFRATDEETGRIKTYKIYGDKVPGRSDLYVYFQLLAPLLLKPRGILCFIISNSWLDVEFGGFMQNVLLHHSHLLAVYDSAVRSFEASVNTVIYLHTAFENTDTLWSPTNQQYALKNTVRFVMNKLNYTDAAFAPLLVEQEHQADNAFQAQYRVIPVPQKHLREAGWNDEKKAYDNDKWGGKYLRAPEMFFHVNNNKKMIEIGNNDYFTCLGYVHDNSTGANFKETLFIKNVRAADNVALGLNNCIQFGVSEHGNSRILADILFPRTIGERHLIIFNECQAIGKEFYRIHPKQNSRSAVLQLNSTVGLLFREVLGITGLGEGALKFNLSSVKMFKVIPDLDISEKIAGQFLYRPQQNIDTELGFDRTRSIREQEPQPLADRKALDDVIFDALDLTAEERKEVYWAAAELVKARLDKARR